MVKNDGWKSRIVGDGVELPEQLLANPKNFRIHSRQQESALVGVLNEVGWVQRVIVNRRTGHVVDGHLRVAASISRGEKSVPVVYVDLSEEEESKVLATLDPLSAMAGQDDGKLSELLNGMETLDDGLAGLLDSLKSQAGSESVSLDSEPKIDRANELNKKWKVKTGDLWQIGDHRLLCGDCSLKSDVQRVMGDDLATLVFTDPPYGVSQGAKNRLLNKCAHGRGGNAGRNRIENDIKDDDLSPEELKKRLLPSFKNIRELVMSDDCSVFVCSPQGGGLGMMMMMMIEAGLEVRHIINWVKNAPTFSMGRLDYDYQHEPIFFTWGKRHKKIMGGQFKTSVWSVNKPNSSKEHPTMKPVELPTCAILNHTDVGDVVADVFLGSGTTMVAAQNARRQCRGMEISPNYCAVILQRMKEAFSGIKIERIK